jgi:hypothetical protein
MLKLVRRNTRSSARPAAILPQGISFHLDAVGIVNQPVEDAVGERGITDLIMPA